MCVCIYVCMYIYIYVCTPRLTAPCFETSRDYLVLCVTLPEGSAMDPVIVFARDSFEGGLWSRTLFPGAQLCRVA